MKTAGTTCGDDSANSGPWSALCFACANRMQFSSGGEPSTASAGDAETEGQSPSRASGRDSDGGSQGAGGGALKRPTLARSVGPRGVGSMERYAEVTPRTLLATLTYEVEAASSTCSPAWFSRTAAPMRQLAYLPCRGKL